MDLAGEYIRKKHIRLNVEYMLDLMDKQQDSVSFHRTNDDAGCENFSLMDREQFRHDFY